MELLHSPSAFKQAKSSESASSPSVYLPKSAELPRDLRIRPVRVGCSALSSLQSSIGILVRERKSACVETNKTSRPQLARLTPESSLTGNWGTGTYNLRIGAFLLTISRPLGLWTFVNVEHESYCIRGERPFVGRLHRRKWAGLPTWSHCPIKASLIQASMGRGRNYCKAAACFSLRTKYA